MRLKYAALAATACVSTFGPALAEDAFVPEKVSVEAKIKPGPNVLSVDQGWSGSSRINILSADDLSRKGDFSVGLVSQLVLTRDKKTAYTTSVYAKRITSGPIEAVLEEFDVETMKLKREIAISPKMAQVAAIKNLLQLTADEKYALVQDATPATSVSVVDLTAGKLIAEIPTPGCWAIYPAVSGLKFSMLCGDGTLASYTFTPDGKFSAPVKSAKIFDADTEPLFVQGERAGKDLLFSSFNGKIYRISDADAAAKLVDKFDYTAGIEGGWGPGGMAMMAYNEANDVLFIGMHPDAKEGSHKDKAKEVWAVDLKAKKVLYRSDVEPMVSIAVTSGKTPLLFGLNDEEGIMWRYEIDPEAKFAAKRAGKAEKIGAISVRVIAGE